jgi:hypothetical protein
MISLSWLSLSPETMQRMASHLVSEETGCRRWERVGATVLVIAIAAAAGLAAFLWG